jgi:hypothetical protein
VIDPRLASHAVERDRVAVDMLTHLRAVAHEVRLTPGARMPSRRPSSPCTMDVNVARRRVNAELTSR